MSLNRVSRPFSSGACRRNRPLLLVIATVLVFLLTQALPEATAMSLGAGSAAWEDAEDDGANSTDEGYRTGALNSVSAELVPVRLPPVSQVFARSAACGQSAYLVAKSPRGPPESM